MCGKTLALGHSVTGPLRLSASILTVAVILMQRPSVSWAAETSERGVSGTLYGGGGTLTVPNNERRPDDYAVTRVGVGVLGVLRPDANAANGADGETTGVFAAMGAAFELESSLHTACGFECFANDHAGGTGERYLAKNFAGRLGIGYSFPAFEARLGLLFARPDPHVQYAMPLVFPDVMARFGRRSRGWFELGLGAYSASTNFRPGLYLGGALGDARKLQVSGHLGLHLVNGLCCSTVLMVGYGGELSVAHAFSSSLSGSVGLTAFDGLSEHVNHLAAEGGSRLTFAW